MRKQDYAKKGKELVRKLKKHILVSLQEHPAGCAGLAIGELQRFAGLTIKGYGNREVWRLAFYALLIDLLKEGHISSESKIRRTRDLNYATKVRIRRS
jgi:hypothetical protein